jgi:hypothetical protein
VLRDFLASRFAAEYAAEPGRFDPVLSGEADGPGSPAALSAAEAANRLRDGWFDAVLGRIVPRLAADLLGLNVTIVHATGVVEQLAPQYGDRVWLLWTQRPRGNYLALEAGQAGPAGPAGPLAGPVSALSLQLAPSFRLEPPSRPATPELVVPGTPHLLGSPRLPGQSVDPEPPESLPSVREHGSPEQSGSSDPGSGSRPSPRAAASLLAAGSVLGRPPTLGTVNASVLAPGASLHGGAWGIGQPSVMSRRYAASMTGSAVPHGVSLPELPAVEAGLEVVAQAAATLAGALVRQEAVNEVRERGDRRAGLGIWARDRGPRMSIAEARSEARNQVLRRGEDAAFLASRRVLAEALAAAEGPALASAEQASAQVRGAIGAIPDWVFGGMPAQQRLNWEAADTAAEVARAQALIAAAAAAAAGAAAVAAEDAAAGGLTPDQVLGPWTVEELADWAGEFGYAQVIHETVQRVNPAAETAAVRFATQAVGPAPGHQAASAVLSAADLAGIAAAAEAATARARAAAQAATAGEVSPEEAGLRAGRAREREIRQQRVRDALARPHALVARGLPSGFGVQLDRIEEAPRPPFVDQRQRALAEVEAAGARAVADAKGAVLAARQQWLSQRAFEAEAHALGGLADAVLADGPEQGPSLAAAPGQAQDPFWEAFQEAQRHADAETERWSRATQQARNELRFEEARRHLGVGEQQQHVAWGEWGQVARVGGQWLGWAEGDAAVARQAAAGLPGELRGPVEAAIAELFRAQGSRRASRRLVSGFEVPARFAGQPHVVTVRLVLGRLRGEGGATYVPAYEVEQWAQMGVLAHSPTDLSHQQLGGTSSGFSNSRSTTLPLTEPTVTAAVSWLTPVNAGPSVVAGGGRSFGRYEGNGAGAERQVFHTTGLAYFAVPANAADARAGSHWELTLRDGAGGVVAVPRAARPAEVLLSFPLDETAPAGQAPPRQLGAPPATGPGPDAPLVPRPADVPLAPRLGPISLPPGATAEQAEEFHAAFVEVFAPFEAVVVDDGPGGLRAAIAGRFAAADQKPGGVLDGGLREEFSEHNLFIRQYMLMTSGIVSPEWDLDGDAAADAGSEKAGSGQRWARLHLTARMTAVERAGGGRDNYVQQDARHLQWAAGAARTVSGSSAVYVDPTVNIPLPGSAMASGTFFPWAGLSQGQSRGQAGALGSGDWRYVGYTTDVVTYAVTVSYTARVSSSHGPANGTEQRDGVIYVKVPVDEAPRFESRLRHAAAAIMIEQLRERLALTEGDETSPRNQERLASIRQEAGQEILSDGPLVLDKVPPPSIAGGRSRGPGVIDLLPGSQHIIPSIMAMLDAADRRRDRGVRKPARDRLHTEAALGRLFSTDSLIPLSSLLVSTGVHHTVVTGLPGGQERARISVRWRPDLGEQPVITRKSHGRIDHYPIGYTSAYASESLSPGFSIGLAPSVAVTLPSSEQHALRKYGLGGGYSYSASRSESSTVTQSAWIAQGWVYEGPLLKVFFAGSFEVSVQVSDIPDPLSSGMLAAVPAYLARTAAAAVTGRPVPDWAAVTMRYRNTRRIRGGLRTMIPESIAVPAGQDRATVMFPVPPRLELARPIVPGHWPGAWVAKTAPAPAGFTAAELGTRDRLGPEDLPAGMPGLEVIRNLIKSMAEAAGIPDEQSGDTLDKHFNEDQVIGRLLGGGGGQRLFFSLARPGFATDRRADVDVEFAFYDAAPTGERIDLDQSDLADSEPELTYSKGKTRSHGWSFLPFKLITDPTTGGIAPGTSGDGGVSFSGNLRTKQRSRTTDITWLTGHWNVHARREFDVYDARVLAVVTLHTWKENLLGKLAPARHTGSVLVEHGLDFYRAPPRPRLLPPPGVPQVLPASQIPLLTNTDQLEFRDEQQRGGGPASGPAPGTGPGLNPVQVKIQEVLAKIDPTALDRKWVIAAPGDGQARLRPGQGLPEHWMSITDKVSLLGQADSILGTGLHLHDVVSGLGHTRQIHLLIRGYRDPRGIGYSYGHSADGGSLANYWVSIANEVGQHGRVKRPVPGVNLQQGADFPVTGSGSVSGVSQGPDYWSPSLGISWTKTEAASANDPMWLREVFGVPGLNHYFEGRIRIVVAAYAVTVPSQPANLLTLGAAKNAASLARKPASPDRPTETAEVDMIERVMVPHVALPAPGRPFPPPAQWEYLPEAPGGTAQDLMESLGVRRLPVTERDILARGVLMLGIVPQTLREIHDHAWKMLTGAATPEERGAPAVPGRLPEWLRERVPEVDSRAVAKMMELGGVGPAWFTTVLGYPATKRYASFMLRDEGFTFPRVVKDIGLITSGTSDTSVRVGFYNAVPDKWHRANAAGDTVRQPARQTARGSSKSVTVSESISPGLAPDGGGTSLSVLPSLVLNSSSSYGNTGGFKTVRSGAFRRRSNYLITTVGVVVIIEVSAVNQAGALKIPDSWGHPVARWLAGGKVRLAYRLDSAGQLDLDPDSAVKLRVLTPDGVPLLPAGRYLPLVSDDPGRDVARLKAAAALPVRGNWYPVSAHYDAAAGRVRMTVLAGRADGRSADLVTEELTAEQAADRIRGLPDWEHRPVLLLAGRAGRPRADGSASFAAGLAALLGVDVLAAFDDVLQEGAAAVAGRFRTDRRGDPVPGTLRPGNWVLAPASGGPVLLGSDLGRVLDTELPVRLRGPVVPPALGVAMPERPVAWTGTRDGLAPDVPANVLGPGALGSGPVDLGAGLMAAPSGLVAAPGGAGPGPVIVIHRAGSDPRQWQDQAALLPRPAGHVTVFVPEPDVAQDALAVAMDRLLADPLLADGSAVVLLVAAGAAGRGPDSLAHRIQLRAQRLTLSQVHGDPLGAIQEELPGGIRGPVIVAPGGSLLRVDRGSPGDGTGLLTFDPDDNLAQWWRFAANASPVPLGVLLPLAQLPPGAPDDGLPDFSVPDVALPGLLAYRIPAGYYVTGTARPPTAGELARLAAVPFETGRVRVLVDASQYPGWRALSPLTNPIYGDTVVVRLLGARPPGLTAEYLLNESVPLGAHVVVEAAAAEPGDNEQLAVVRPLDRPAPLVTRGPAVTGVPNGAVQADVHGAPEVWRSGPGTPRWRPFAQYVTELAGATPPAPARSPVVTAVQPASAWLREADDLEQDALEPALFTLDEQAGGAVLEVTAAGLWIREEAGPGLAAGADAVRGRIPAYGGPVISIGIPGQPVSEPVWALARWVLARLRPAAARGGQLVVAADTDPAAEQQAGRLAALAGLARAGQGQVAAARSKPDRVSRVTQAGPLPAYQPPGPQLPPPAPIPALPAETGALVSMEHGIPHGEVVAGSLSVDLGDRVVANDLPIERAYIIGPRYQPGPADAAGDGMTGGRRPQLALPGGRFFRARILGHHPPRDQIGPDQILVRVSIPAGAAILPNATRAALAGDDGTPQDQEVWLPPNTLARIRLTRAYATWGPVVTGMAASGDLAAITAGVPQAGSAEVTAPAWAWTDAEIEEHFLAGREEIDAGWWFRGPADADAPREHVHRIPRQPDETVLFFSVNDQHQPVLNGRALTEGELARVLAVLTARHPQADQRAFRLATYLPGGYVQAVVNLTRRPVIAASTTVFLAAEGFRHGTLIATTAQADASGAVRPAMPPDGQWFLFTLGALPQDLSQEHDPYRLLPPTIARPPDESPAVTGGADAL